MKSIKTNALLAALVSLGAITTVVKPAFSQQPIAKYKCFTGSGTVDPMGRSTGSGGSSFTVLLFNDYTAVAEGVLNHTIPYRGRYNWQKGPGKDENGNNAEFIVFQGVMTPIMPGASLASLPHTFGGEVVGVHIKLTATDQNGGMYVLCQSTN